MTTMSHLLMLDLNILEFHRNGMILLQPKILFQKQSCQLELQLTNLPPKTDIIYISFRVWMFSKSAKSEHLSPNISI